MIPITQGKPVSYDTVLYPYSYNVHLQLYEYIVSESEVYITSVVLQYRIQCIHVYYAGTRILHV